MKVVNLLQNVIPPHSFSWSISVVTGQSMSMLCRSAVANLSWHISHPSQICTVTAVRPPCDNRPVSYGRLFINTCPAEKAIMSNETQPQLHYFALIHHSYALNYT